MCNPAQESMMPQRYSDIPDALRADIDLLCINRVMSPGHDGVIEYVSRICVLYYVDMA